MKVTTDVSRSYIGRILSMETAVRDVASFEAEMCRSLQSIPLLVTPLDNDMIRTTDKLFSYVSCESNENMGMLEGLLASSYRYVLPTDSTEEDFASLADSLTGQAWCRFDEWLPTLFFRSSRNSADTSGATAVGARPDYCLWINNHLVLKAEHKRTEAEFDTAVNELASKMLDWDVSGLRELPFLPCYAVGGKWLCFLALTRPALGTVAADTTVRPVSKMFDMSKPAQRIAIIHASINMFRVLASLRQLLPHAAARLYQRITRGDGDFLQILGNSVLKVCKIAAPPEVYEWLMSNPRPDTMILIQSIKRSKAGESSIVLSPVCVEVLPSTEDDLRVSLRSILSALHDFHCAGFVHRDVRWPNILRSSRGWLLADFELAAFTGRHLPAGAIAEKFLPPEVFIHHAPYESHGDLFCVGLLFRSAGIHALSTAALALSQRLCSENPLLRPSASAALSDAWFAV